MATRKKERGTDNFQYAGIVDGNFTIKVKEGTEGAVKRVNKKGDTIHELVFNEIYDVFLRGIEVKETEYGNQLQILLKEKENPEKHLTLQIPLESAFATSLMDRIENIDLAKTITLEIFKIKNVGDDGKEYTTNVITVKQDGKTLERKYTKITKVNGKDVKETTIPKSEPIMKGGKQVKKNGYLAWDTTAREGFFTEIIQGGLSDKIENYWIEVGTNQNESDNKQETDVESLDELFSDNN